MSLKINTLIGLDKGFVIYCSDDDCGSSEDLAYELQERGFMNIFVFKGGWKEWIDAKMTIGGSYVNNVRISVDTIEDLKKIEEIIIKNEQAN